MPESAPLVASSRPEHIFPALSAEQIARVAAHGKTRQGERGEVLVEPGDRLVPFFVITSGTVEIVRLFGAAETMVVVHEPGQFTGEINMLSGRPSLIRARFGEPGSVIELDHDELLALVQNDRRPDLKNLSRFEGSGIYYGATFIEAQLCGGDEVIVVGGGNSAGQAAVFLAQTARKVYMLVRSTGLAESMSRYLIRRIEDSPKIELRTRTEIVALEGTQRLERVQTKDHETGDVETHDIGHVFLMTGAVPSTEWLDGCVARDAKGFIKTGSNLSPDELRDARWPLARPPHLLETNLPGVFAVGDVRSGSIKRVASAVGEGSIAVSFVHQVLHE